MLSSTASLSTTTTKSASALSRFRATPDAKIRPFSYPKGIIAKQATFLPLAMFDTTGAMAAPSFPARLHIITIEA